MKNSRYIWRPLCVGFCAVTTVLAAWVGLAQQTRQPDANALRNAAQSTEWLTYGGNCGETRYSPLRQIDAANVGRIGLAWSATVGSGGGNQEATPLLDPIDALDGCSLEDRKRIQRRTRSTFNRQRREG